MLLTSLDSTFLVQNNTFQLLVSITSLEKRKIISAMTSIAGNETYEFSRQISMVEGLWKRQKMT